MNITLLTLFSPSLLPSFLFSLFSLISSIYTVFDLVLKLATVTLEFLGPHLREVNFQLYSGPPSPVSTEMYYLSLEFSSLRPSTWAFYQWYLAVTTILDLSFSIYKMGALDSPHVSQSHPALKAGPLKKFF